MKLPPILAAALLLLSGLWSPPVLRAGELVFEPAESYFGSFDFEHDYHNKVRSILLKDVSDQPMALMVVLPGLYQEYAVALEGKDDHYYVVRLMAGSHIWSSKGEDVKVAVERTEIEADLAKLVQNVVFAAVSQTRYPPTGTLGADGVDYYFASFRLYDGVRAGKTWSPADGTLSKALVDYMEALVDYAKAGKVPEQKQRLLATGHDLLARLAKNAN